MQANMRFPKPFRARILLADDHAIVAEVITRMLADDVDVVEVIADGNLLLEAARRVEVDAIVSDINMPGRSGLSVLKELRAGGSRVPFLFVTMHNEPALVAAAMRAGANGYVLKDAGGGDLAEAIQQVVAGGSYVTPSVVGHCLEKPISQAPSLTGKQREILHLIADGCRPKQIAGHMGISVRTVEAHKYSMMQSLFVNSTLGLVRRARELGLLF